MAEVGTIWQVGVVGASVGFGFWMWLWFALLKARFPTPTSGDVRPGAWQLLEGTARRGGEAIREPIGAGECLAWGLVRAGRDDDRFKSFAVRSVPFYLENAHVKYEVRLAADTHLMGRRTAFRVWDPGRGSSAEDQCFISELRTARINTAELPAEGFREVSIRDGDVISVAGQFDADGSTADGLQKVVVSGQSKPEWRSRAFVLQGTRAEAIGRVGPGFGSALFVALLCGGVMGIFAATVVMIGLIFLGG